MEVRSDGGEGGDGDRSHTGNVAPGYSESGPQKTGINCHRRLLEESKGEGLLTTSMQLHKGV